MAQTQIRGNTQIQSQSITEFELSSSVVGQNLTGSAGQPIRVVDDFNNISGTFQYLSASNAIFNTASFTGKISASHLDPGTIYRSFVFNKVLTFSGSQLLPPKYTWYVSGDLVYPGSEMLFVGGLVQDSGTTEDYIYGERVIGGVTRSYFEFQYVVPSTQKVKINYIPKTNSLG